MKQIILSIIFLTYSPFVTGDKYFGPYEHYFIISLGDLYRVCERITNPDSNDNESFIKNHTCITYFSGMLTGYSSTLSILAERDTAKELGIPHSEIANELHTNEELHKKLSEKSESYQFLCRKQGIHIGDLAKEVISNLRNKGISGDRSPHYYVLNEFSIIQPCK